MAFISVLVIGLMLSISVGVLAEEAPWLLGTWNGQRETLADKGIEFEFALTLEETQNVSGGVARSSRGLLNLDLIMEARGRVLGFSDQEILRHF